MALFQMSSHAALNKCTLTAENYPPLIANAGGAVKLQTFLLTQSALTTNRPNSGVAEADDDDESQYIFDVDAIKDEGKTFGDQTTRR